jgi:hypothetical protein
VPLLAVSLYFLLDSSVDLGAALRILALLVAVTLTGTAATLLVLRAARPGGPGLLGP